MYLYFKKNLIGVILIGVGAVHPAPRSHRLSIKKLNTRIRIFPFELLIKGVPGTFKTIWAIDNALICLSEFDNNILLLKTTDIFWL